MEKTIENRLLPSDFFRAVLLELAERGKTEFPINKVEWHRAFYSAIQEYGDKLPEFEVLKRTNPYVHDLERSIYGFMLTGQLSHVFNVRGDTYRAEKIGVMEKIQEEFDNPKKEQLKEVARYICDRI